MIQSALQKSVNLFLARGEAKRIKFSERNPALWQRLLSEANPQTLTVCRHLESVEADRACRCGYAGSVWADGERVLFTMGDMLYPEHPEMHTPRIERAAEIATAQLLTCLYNNADWLIGLAASAIEAREGGDGEAGSVHESAAPKADAQPSPEPTP